MGTGSSGIQVISEVAQEAGELFVLQRTPSYTIPLRNKPVEPGHALKMKRQYEELRDRQFNSFSGFTLVHSNLAPPPSQSALEVSEEERRAEYENRWASGGLSPYYAFTDSLLDMTSNKTLADFAREKIRERVDDPEVAEKLCPDYPILTRRLSPRPTTSRPLTSPTLSSLIYMRNPSSTLRPLASLSVNVRSSWMPSSSPPGST